MMKWINKNKMVECLCQARAVYLESKSKCLPLSFSIIDCRIEPNVEEDTLRGCNSLLLTTNSIGKGVVSI